MVLQKRKFTENTLHLMKICISPLPLATTTHHTPIFTGVEHQTFSKRIQQQVHQMAFRFSSNAEQIFTMLIRTKYTKNKPVSQPYFLRPQLGSRLSKTKKAVRKRTRTRGAAGHGFWSPYVPPFNNSQGFQLHSSHDCRYINLCCSQNLNVETLLFKMTRS